MFFTQQQSQLRNQPTCLPPTHVVAALPKTRSLIRHVWHWRLEKNGALTFPVAGQDMTSMSRTQILNLGNASWLWQGELGANPCLLLFQKRSDWPMPICRLVKGWNFPYMWSFGLEGGGYYTIPQRLPMYGTIKSCPESYAQLFCIHVQ